MLGAWTRNRDELKNLFSVAKPYPHVVIDGFLKPVVAEKILSDFPPEESKIWHRYKNPIEDKLACNDLQNLPNSIRSLLEFLNQEEFLKLASEISGIPALLPDSHLHGGGIHYHPTGGKLDVHLDYSIHPISKKERRLNLILYLNPGWKEEYGGCLELWDEKMEKCVKKVEPIFNRAVLFRVSDISYHGLPDPIRDPKGRKSLATYYLTEPREGIVFRPKALFVARPNDEKNEVLDRLRSIRAERLITDSDWKVEI